MQLSFGRPVLPPGTCTAGRGGLLGSCDLRRAVQVGMPLRCNGGEARCQRVAGTHSPAIAEGASALHADATLNLCGPYVRVLAGGFGAQPGHPLPAASCDCLRVKAAVEGGVPLLRHPRVLLCKSSTSMPMPDTICFCTLRTTGAEPGPGPVADLCSPLPRWAVIVALPMHPSRAGDGDVGRLQAAVEGGVPLGCDIWAPGC